jgi:hypothetical protein
MNSVVGTKSLWDFIALVECCKIDARRNSDGITWSKFISINAEGSRKNDPKKNEP